VAPSAHPTQGVERASILPEFWIESEGAVRINAREIWDYRELLYFFVWRDIKVRYKQTVLGATWAIVQPVATMLVFTLFFGKIAKLPSDGLPYPVFALSGLIVWTFFSNALTQSSASVVGSASLITKIYFPRLIIPIASVLAGVVDFMIAFVALLGLMVWYRIAPSTQVVWVPAFLILAVISSLGVGIWMAALNVKYRDVHHVLPFVVQFWMLATPIVYPSSMLREPWRTLYALNPMVGVVEGMRWAVLRTDTGPGPMIIASSAAALAIFVSGAYYFRRAEAGFADVV